jgi:pimeloyl-ACP methyl ester carboxylesterase
MSPASFNTRYTEAAAELQKKRFTREDSITRVKILASELYKHKDRQAYEQLYRNLFRSSFYNRAMADSLTLTLPYDFDERIAKLHYTYRHEWFYNFTTKLNEIPVQTLILYGDSDQLPQEAYAEMAKRIPHNTAIKLSHCGHFPFIEAKDSLFSAIRTFLKKVN